MLIHRCPPRYWLIIYVVTWAACNGGGAGLSAGEELRDGMGESDGQLLWLDVLFRVRNVEL
jgi:hypothetical protein